MEDYNSRILRNFWTTRWHYERTPEQWLIRSSLNNHDLGCLLDAVDKLVLEKKVLKVEGVNLKNMINSPDTENRLVAIIVMAQLKPKKFKKECQTQLI